MRSHLGRRLTLRSRANWLEPQLTGVSPPPSVPAMPPTKRQPEGETLQFMQRMWDFVHALDVCSKRMMQSIGVTGPQRLVLRVPLRAP